jgi:hypothetical protein
MIDRCFIAGGNAYFTVEPSKAFASEHGTKAHYTYRVSRPKPKAVNEAPAPFFASVLCGPQNTTDYRYVGIYRPNDGGLVITKGSKFAANDWEACIFRRVVQAIHQGRGAEIEAAGWTVQHNNHCCRCGHLLTVPASIETGIGPECEVLVFAGFVHLGEIPQSQFPLIAKVQASYWMQAQKDIFGPMKDACLDCGFDEERAQQLVAATKYSMRKFKKGKDWPEAFKLAVAS